MKTDNKKESSYRIRFLVQLPTHTTDFDYSLNKDQVADGSIILAHVPLKEDDQKTLISAFHICKESMCKSGGTV
jgi:hypothetical protein